MKGFQVGVIVLLLGILATLLAGQGRSPDPASPAREAADNIMRGLVNVQYLECKSNKERPCQAKEVARQKCQKGDDRACEELRVWESYPEY